MVAIKETIDRPRASPGRDASEPFSDDEEDARLFTFGPLPNEEPPASAIILDYLCNAELTCVPHACTGGLDDDVGEWEKIAHKIERKKRKKKKGMRPPSPKAMLLSVRQNSESSLDSRSTNNSTDTDNSRSTTGKSTISDDNSKSNAHKNTSKSAGSNNSGGSSSTARRRRNQERMLPPRAPDKPPPIPSAPIVIGEQRDDVGEVAKGRGKYSNKKGFLAAAKSNKQPRIRRRRSTPISYTIPVKAYSSSREGPGGDDESWDTKEDDDTMSTTENDVDTLNDDNTSNITDEANEETESQPPVSTLGSF